MRDINADALEELRKDGLADGWSHSTIDRMMGTVSAVLKAAVTWEMLDRAPAVPMYRPRSTEPRALTHEEFDRLCSYLPMHLKLAAKLATFTLLRMRAMLKLEWSRIDLAERRMWIPGAHQKAGRTLGLSLSGRSVAVLRALRWLSPPSSPYVFVWNGKPIDDCNTASFKAAVNKAHLAPLRWHDLRHTGASWAVQNGATLQEIMLLGDWRDYRSVLRYAHLAPSQTARAAELVAHGVAHEAPLTEARNAPKLGKRLVERKGIEPSTFALRRRA
jgi:integrase